MAHGPGDTVHPDLQGETSSCRAAEDCLLTSWWVGSGDKGIPDLLVSPLPFTPSLLPGPWDGTISIQGGSSLLS